MNGTERGCTGGFLALCSASRTKEWRYSELFRLPALVIYIKKAHFWPDSLTKRQIEFATEGHKRRRIRREFYEKCKQRAAHAPAATAKSVRAGISPSLIDFRAASVSFSTQINIIAHGTFEHAVAIEIIESGRRFTVMNASQLITCKLIAQHYCVASGEQTDCRAAVKQLSASSFWSAA